MNQFEGVKDSILDLLEPNLDYDWKYKEGDHVVLDIDNIEKESIIIKKINDIIQLKEDDFFIIGKNNYFNHGMYKFNYIVDEIPYDFIIDERYINKAPLNILLKYYEEKEDYEKCAELINNYE